MKFKKRLRIACLSSGVTLTATDMIRGICRYSRETGEWDLFETGVPYWSSPIRNLQSWGPDGIIAGSYHTERDAATIAMLGVPTVVLLQNNSMRKDSYPLRECSCCLWDSSAIGKMAAQHFIDRNFTHYAYADATEANSYWSLGREKSFRTAVSNLSRPHTYHRYGQCSLRDAKDWMRERIRMARWLLTLPKPCAVFAPNDRRGGQVLDACRIAGITVPDEISVLGVDNSWICESSLPTLSSIACDLEQAGYDIARHLDKLIRKETNAHVEIPVRPTKVHIRQSTDWFSTSDNLVQQILCTIQSKALNPLFSISDLATQTGFSRTILESRFRKFTGRTMRREVERIRLAHARDLLIESNLSIDEIAHSSGFNSSTHFGRIFQGRFGASPSEWKRYGGDGRWGLSPLDGRWGLSPLGC